MGDESDIQAEAGSFDGDAGAETLGEDWSGSPSAWSWKQLAAGIGTAVGFVGTVLPGVAVLYSLLFLLVMKGAAEVLEKVDALRPAAFVGGFWMALFALGIGILLQGSRSSSATSAGVDDADEVPSAGAGVSRSGGVLGAVVTACVLAVLAAKLEAKTGIVPDPVMAGLVLLAFGALMLAILWSALRILWWLFSACWRLAGRSDFAAGTLTATGLLLGPGGLVLLFSLVGLGFVAGATEAAQAPATSSELRYAGFGSSDVVEKIREAFVKVAEADEPTAVLRTPPSDAEECTSLLHLPLHNGTSTMSRARSTLRRYHDLSEADIDDLLQDAILRVCIEYDVAKIRNLDQLFITSADRRAKTYLKRGAKMMSCELEFDPSSEQFRVEPAEPLLSATQDRALKQEWCRLTEEQQHVVFLRLIEGRSFKESARLLGIREGQARDRFHYARKKLAAAIRYPGAR